MSGAGASRDMSRRIETRAGASFGSAATGAGTSSPVDRVNNYGVSSAPALFLIGLFVGTTILD
jgi:putative effector of murein hydrolase